jgi:hypothetical protein
MYFQELTYIFLFAQVNPSPVSHLLCSGMLRDPPTLTRCYARGTTLMLWNEALLWKINTAITQQAPFPFGEGRGDRSSRVFYE